MPGDAVDRDLHWCSAWQLRDLIATGDVTAEAVVTAHLERIKALEPTVHAFITVAAERALDHARHADAAVAAGRPLGPLHGVPVALKDEAWTEGILSTGGSRLYEDFVPTEDGIVARRLRDAGAVIIGKTNMPEFAMHSRSLSLVGGETVNPWDTTRSAGASSGGSAAALAAGMLPIAIGSDGGGSIRIPSAHCGLQGLHPTPGRVPSRGSFSYSPHASMGPMARDVRDVATLLQAISGHDPADPTSADREVPDLLAALDGDIRGLRVGFCPDFGYIPVDPAIVDVVHDAAASLIECGAVVVDLDLRLTDYWEAFSILTRGAGRFSGKPVPFIQTDEFDALRRRPDNFERLCAYTQMGLQAPPFTQEQYEKADAERSRLRSQFEAAFETVDVIVTPTVHVPAPVLPDGWGSPYDDEWKGTPFTAVVNILYLTAASSPAGFVRGLPVGLHTIGRSWCEDTVLRVCRALELVRPWTARPPLSGNPATSATPRREIS